MPAVQRTPVAVSGRGAEHPAPRQARGDASGLHQRELRLAGPDAADGNAAPVTDRELAARLARLGPFEPNPAIAVAVSGGPDSLALTLLMTRWVRARGGRLHALTLDHGLRPEAADEAAWLAEQLANHGIAHTTLTWRPEPDAHVSHAKARAARYERLAAWCAEHRVLHLLAAHHLDDQAETLLARARMNSGPDGLAGMPAVRHLRDLRLVRPLLDIPKARLEATLAAMNQPWITDPSNRDARYGRPYLRRLMPMLADAGMSAGNLGAYADIMGRARTRLDAARSDLAARAIAVFPEGYAAVDPAPILDAPAAVGGAVMGRVLRCIGGRDHMPRGRRLDRLMADLRAAPRRGRTLGGCRIAPWREQWLILREPGRAPRIPMAANSAWTYDHRFHVVLDRGAESGMFLAPLGERGWAALRAQDPACRAGPIPPPVRPSLPAVFDAAGPYAVPHLDWRRTMEGPRVAIATFAPPRPIGEARFTVAPA